MVEILKQGQFAPMNVVDQVIIIYAANNGYLDSVPVAQVREFEQKLLDHVRDSHGEWREKFIESKELTEDVESEICKIIEAFKETWSA